MRSMTPSPGETRPAAPAPFWTIRRAAAKAGRGGALA